MLTQNLDILKGMCNRTRMTDTELRDNVSKAKIISGGKAAKEIHINQWFEDKRWLECYIFKPAACRVPGT